jgi:hypothetical protein
MALFCAQYLSSAPFNPKQDNFSIKKHCLAGYYGLLDYAVANWWKHASRPGVTPDQHIPSEVRKLLSTLNSSSEGENEVAAINDATEVWAQTRHLQDDGKRWEAAFPTGERVKPIRNCLESLFNGPSQQDSENLEDVRELYGRVDYKCEKPWCHFFILGFDIPQVRQDHMAQHERPFRCGSDGCYGYQIGFAKESELVKHNNRVHCQVACMDFPPAVGNTRIFAAAKNGKVDVLQALVGSGIDINAMSNDKATPLFLAAKAGHYQVCRWLLEQGAEVDTRCSWHKRTALYNALVNNDLEIARLLLDHDADIFARESTVANSRDLLNMAVDNKNVALVILFLGQLRRRNDRFQVGGKILPKVIRYGDVAMLKVLLPSGCIAANRDDLALAINLNKHKVLEELIAHKDFGALLNDELLLVAVASGVANMVELVLSTGRLQITNNEPIMRALRDKRPLIAEILLRYRKLRLIDGQLKECGELARQMGFEDVAAVIDKIKGFQRKLLMFGGFPYQARLCN